MAQVQHGKLTFEDGESDSYLASLSDLMVGMLFIFIMMLMAFALTYRSAQDESEKATAELEQRLQEQIEAEREAKQELAKQKALSEQIQSERRHLEHQNAVLARAQGVLTENDQIRRVMLRRIQEALRQRGVQVIIDEQNGVLRLPDSLLFDSGQSVLRDEGAAAVSDLASVLMEILPCYTTTEFAPAIECPANARPVLEAIYIEGHTDNVPIAKGNWVLSTERAVRTFQAMVESDLRLATIRNVNNQSLLGVSGYGEERPVDTNATENGRAHNRRIDLRFLLAAPSVKDLERIRERVRQGLGDSPPQ